MQWSWLPADRAHLHSRTPAASNFYIPYASLTATGVPSPPAGEPLLLLPKLNLRRFPENSKKKHPAAHYALFGGKPKKPGDNAALTIQVALKMQAMQEAGNEGTQDPL
eukprot:gene1182-1750_t